VGKPLKRHTLGRPRKGWEDNINMDLREIDCQNGSGWNWLRTMSDGRLWY
jgi:hypothetical protein